MAAIWAVLGKVNATIAARRTDVAGAEADLLQQQSSIAKTKAQLGGAKQAANHASRHLAAYEPLGCQRPRD